MKLLRSNPLAIGVALNGAQYSAKEFSSIPVTPSQAAEQALESVEQGAVYVHTHSREPKSGEQFADPEFFRFVHEELTKRAPQVEKSAANSRKGLVGNQVLSSIAALRLRNSKITTDQLIGCELIRAVGMDTGPDMMTAFTALESKLGAGWENGSAVETYTSESIKGYTDPGFIAAYYEAVSAMYSQRRIVPEYEVTTMSALWTVESLIRRHLVPKHPHFIFLFGFSARLPIAKEVFDLCMSHVRYLKATYDVDPSVSVGAVIQPRFAASKRREMSQQIENGKHDYLELLEWAMHDETVDCVRVGLEDTPFHFGHEATNAELVALVREECGIRGVQTLFTGTEIRKLFHQDW
jgi:uncharacterized protein (DUF849 family)